MHFAPLTPHPASASGLQPAPTPAIRRFAMVIGLVLSLALFAACSNSATTDAERNDEGEIDEVSDLGVFRMQTGDCVLFPDDDTDEFSEFEALPCDQPHDGEVLSLVNLPFDNDALFPGNLEVQTLAEEACIEDFDRITGLDFATDPDWNVFSLSPSSESWDQIDDREVVCIAVSYTDEQLTTLLPRP